MTIDESFAVLCVPPAFNQQCVILPPTHGGQLIILQLLIFDHYRSIPMLCYQRVGNCHHQLCICTQIRTEQFQRRAP